MINKPGRQPTKAEQLSNFYSNLIEKRSDKEHIIVHHVTEDTAKRLQLEVERRCPINGLVFERKVF